MAAEEHSTSGMTESTEAHAPAEGGLPQFQFEHWGGQIVWLLLIFAVLYVLLSKVFIPRIRRVMDLRAQTIAEAVNAARLAQNEAEDQAKAGAADLAAARAESQRLASDAKAKSAKAAAERQAIEDAKLAEKLSEAEARIRKTRDAALANVQQVASEAAAAMVDKLTGKAATSAEMSAALTGKGVN